MVEKAPIVKEYKRAGTFLGMRGTRVLRLVTTFLTIGRHSVSVSRRRSWLLLLDVRPV